MKTFLVNSSSFFNYTVTGIGLAAFGCWEVMQHQYMGAAVFLTATIVYAIAAVRHGAIVRMNDLEARLKPVFSKERSIHWASVREVGLLNTDEFGEHKMLSRGAEYFYLSDHVMTEAERFAMGNNWPPKDKVYLKKTEQVKAEILSHYCGKIMIVERPKGK